MQVKDRLASAPADVEDRAIAFGEFAFGGKLGGNEQDAAKKSSVLGRGIIERDEMLARTDQDVRGGLGVDVFEGKDFWIFVDNLCRGFLATDSAKEAIGHSFLVVEAGPWALIVKTNDEGWEAFFAAELLGQ